MSKLRTDILFDELDREARSIIRPDRFLVTNDEMELFKNEMRQRERKEYRKAITHLELPNYGIDMFNIVSYKGIPIEIKDK